MSKIDVYNFQRDKTGELELNVSVFATEVKEHLLYAAVRYQLAKRRAGTHAVKRRSDVRGGGRKPFRQKGTGRARQGTIRAAQMRGGGVVFGPEPRTHNLKMNKKERVSALRSALSRRAEENALLVLDSIELDESKTKSVVDFLARFEIRDALFITAEKNESLVRAASNVGKVTVLPSAGLNVYDILRRDNLVITRAALDSISMRLGGGDGA